MTAFQESAVALAGGGEPSMQGNLEENSPTGHLFLPFCSQFLVHLTSPGSPSKPQCAAAAEPQPEQGLLRGRAFVQAGQGHLESSVCVCVLLSFQGNQAGNCQSLFFPERILSDLDDFLQFLLS